MVSAQHIVLRLCTGSLGSQACSLQLHCFSQGRKELVFSQMHRPIQRDKATSPWYPAAEDDPVPFRLNR